MDGIMVMTVIDDPILSRFRSAIAEVYGDRIEHLVLYGSRARGDARADSDYDIAVFLRDLCDRVHEMNRLADLGTDFLYSTGCVIHATPYPAASYQERSPLMAEIRRSRITPAQAQEAVEMAVRFVAAVTVLIEP